MLKKRDFFLKTLLPIIFWAGILGLWLSSTQISCSYSAYDTINYPDLLTCHEPNWLKDPFITLCIFSVAIVPIFYFFSKKWVAILFLIPTLVLYCGLVFIVTYPSSPSGEKTYIHIKSIDFNAHRFHLAQENTFIDDKLRNIRSLLFICEPSGILCDQYAAIYCVLEADKLDLHVEDNELHVNANDEFVFSINVETIESQKGTYSVSACKISN